MATNIFSPLDKNTLCTQLDQLMQEKRLFLEHDLSLEQITQEIGTNRTYLLQALKEDKGITFKEYINRLRISYAEKLMEDKQTLTKIGHRNDVRLQYAVVFLQKLQYIQKHEIEEIPPLVPL